MFLHSLTVKLGIGEAKPTDLATNPPLGLGSVYSAASISTAPAPK